MTPKTCSVKENKSDKLNFIQMRYFCSLKDTAKGRKNKLYAGKKTSGDKIFGKITFIQCILRTQSLTVRKHPIRKRVKNFKGCFTKNGSDKYMKRN